MRKCLFFCILLLFPVISNAQTYKYIGVEDGLSNRRVYAIQKDKKGYMWFLTHDGIDRYNGKEFKQYKLMDGDEEVNSMMNLNWLYLDSRGTTLWEIGKKGRVFRYDSKHDRFRLVYKLPESEVKGRPTPVSYGFIDSNDIVWLCNEDALYLYNSNTQKVTFIQNEIGERITDIVQIDSTHYFIGTDVGIHYAELLNNILKLSPCAQLDLIKIQINELYYHELSNKVFIGTFQRGMYVYDMNKHQIMYLHAGLTDVSINCIRAFGDKEILIATDGAGVYKMNTETYECMPYITADYNRYNAMNGNTINDLYIDDEQRIWMANYPIGITVRNNKYADYQWIKHSIGNKQSLVNNQVNAVIEDTDGDLWFATNNGISLYISKTGQWHSFLSGFDAVSIKNNTFISLCEVSPGIIWAGSYSSGIYQINKKKLSVDFFTPSLFSKLNIRPDKYIRAMLKASDGKIWSGGYYNLKEIDYVHKNIRYFPELSGITTIVEKDTEHMWIGTATGLYLLEKETGKFRQIQLPVESYYIYSLYQMPDGLLYIGTNNAGLLIYNAAKDTFDHYHKDNCALISNNIYTILYDGNRDIFLSTENGLTSFNPIEKIFRNWTKEQGLKSDHFNATSGTLRKNGDFVFGSTDGAIEFNKSMELPRNYKFKMVFSDLRVFYQTVYPKDEGSPLILDIDDTESLHLKYNQNIFSLQVSSINYDYPSMILYSWKLEGFYDGWSRPGQENIIRFTNLSPGEYTLRVRAISNEDRRVVLEERCMHIVIEQPVWLSIWALIFYAIIIVSLAGVTVRVIVMRKQRKISDEKIHFFVNTAHDIRTPLTLIKAPLEELLERETLSENGHDNMNTALRNVNALLRLTTNLINFERADTYSGNLYVSEYELSTYMEETINAFRSYAEIKHVTLTYESNFRYLNIWMDKDKMDSILKNIISNALKYTHEGGSVRIYAAETEDTWSFEVKDTGIGIPASEQKKLFKMHFRGSNAINSKVTGSGIGLLLVSKLVSLHKGKLNFSSTEGKGFSIKATFPKSEKHYRKAIHRPHPNMERVIYTASGVPVKTSAFPSSAQIYKKAKQHPQNSENLAKILIVEDNDELREYLRNTLSETYHIQVCSNGKMALAIVNEYLPHLIISDIMMPEMRGDELCQTLKNNIETSHIPIILLTALNADKNIIEGLQTGADEYIVKPFNIGILRATIANLLNNRALLRHKYANLELNDDKHDVGCINCSTDLDWKFIATVKKHVEENMDNPGFNVEVLCGLMNMSRTSFYNKITALTDEAPGDYIRLIKLKRASILLLEHKYSITEIAEKTGFSDAKYFREVFKKHFKVSPSQYAKQESNK
ncbi:response regulator [Bacteroides helcogenes]|uniref:histidine kinase n=1 Tax=Bacteroides helcogenes (strain ATCC 35417 / DSM 20613 / JCM 6297 / CCUG 15421 / P 36-108) TaxID=693979 RepID=E6SQH8_BACT6|nr:response regulator [Bacteroides helcogenes]ADV45025.1 histidine kinase [Bacteroides helcogenes P 36-108]MDY5239883.1 response regulator [Bacteroides helcogenes]